MLSALLGSSWLSACSIWLVCPMRCANFKLGAQPIFPWCVISPFQFLQTLPQQQTSVVSCSWDIVLVLDGVVIWFCCDVGNSSSAFSGCHGGYVSLMWLVANEWVFSHKNCTPANWANVLSCASLSWLSQVCLLSPPGLFPGVTGVSSWVISIIRWLQTSWLSCS